MAQAQNHLIQSLPAADRKRLLSLCDPVELVLSQVLCEAGSAAEHVLFPVDGFVSLVTTVPAHGGIEVGMAGREGALGVQFVLGVDAAPTRAVVQGQGSAWRIARGPFLHELAASETLRQVLHRYVYVMLSQLAMASACRRFHDISPRLARWLLMSQDRAHADHFRVTHESMALMLGVRRVGVTQAAGTLQTAGLIRYHRGQLVVLDRPGLQAQACSCYAADLAIYEKHLGREPACEPAQVATLTGSRRAYSSRTTA